MRNFLLFFWLFLSASTIAQQKFEVFFDFNKDVPNGASKNVLSRWIASNSNCEVTAFYGYADSIDDNSYNKNLSSRRIKSVRKILSDNNITVRPDAVEKPFGEDFTPRQNQALNRNVTFFYSISAKQRPLDTTAVPLAALFEKRAPGDIIRIQNIHFYRNKEEVIPESVPILRELLQVMYENPKLSIEIHGHICCNPNPNDTRLSYRRAKFIFTYLLENGIALNRLAYKGFGSIRRIYEIPEKNHAEQLANRRVEILIVRI